MRIQKLYELKNKSKIVFIFFLLQKSFSSLQHQMNLNLQVLGGEISQSTNSIRIDDHHMKLGLADDQSFLDLARALLHHFVGFVLGDVWNEFY